VGAAATKLPPNIRPHVSFSEPLVIGRLPSSRWALVETDRITFDDFEALAEAHTAEDDTSPAPN